jgi:ATP-dependent helicase/nuclease subunit A
LEYRKKIKETIEKLKKLFSINEAEYYEDFCKLFPLIRSLFYAVKKFKEELKKFKLKKNILDFGDLEHLLLKLLVIDKDAYAEIATPYAYIAQTGNQQTLNSSTGKILVKTKLAQNLSEEFDEILIDEYQDTNEIQDLIFRAISKQEKNLFIVGDAKQSIYGFRQAMPEIFIKKKETYELYNQIMPIFPAKIILEKNFRSKKEIIDAVNFIFDQLMSCDIGGINYDQEEKMVAGIENSKNKAAPLEQKEKSLYLNIIESENSGEELDVIEARYTAQIINKMVSEGYKVQDGDTSRPVKFSDFCILFRNTKQHMETFKRILEESMSVCSDTSENFFALREITTVISLLRVIDNPVQDIPLLAVLTGPIFGFSLDELAQIRSKDKENALFISIKNTANSHCIYFLEKLEEYRNLAKTLTISHLLDYIYYKLGIISMIQVFDNGNSKVANLKRFLLYARDYERSAQNNSLSGFLNLIDKLEANQTNLEGNSAESKSENAVKIMSIHRSKGLEFPICILANCSRKFHKDHEDLLLHPKLGIGMKIRDLEKMYQYTTLQREAISLEIKKEETSEELRILYVALTRAKQKLILLSTVKNLTKTLQRLSIGIASHKKTLAFTIKNCQSFTDWLLLCALRHPSGDILREMIYMENEIVEITEGNWEIEIVTSKIIAQKDSSDPPGPEKAHSDPDIIKKSVCDHEIFLELSRRFDYYYDKKDLLGIPAKISVSELAKSYNSDSYEANLKPSFLDSQKHTATERGSALHYFLQVADFNKAKNNLKNYCFELIKTGILSEQQKTMLDFEKLHIFFQSDLVKRILASPYVLREYRFTVDIKSSTIKKDLTGNLKDELVVLQGAIDCIFEEDGYIVIVDYKTDKTKTTKKLVELYSHQLNLYRYAIERCTDKKVKSCIIYSFDLGKEIII